MTPYITAPETWQESWDRQQEAYLPDREHRFAAMLDVVDAVTDGAPPRLLDLAGGTGTISLRALSRFPAADVTLLRDQAAVVTADLASSDWRASLPHREYDAVLTATALHWLPGERLRDLYAEVHGVLRPGGVLVNADHMPDDGLPALSKALTARAEARRSARYAAGAALSWSDWWDRAGADPVLAPLVKRRWEIYPSGHHSAWTPPVSWHLDALRAAGFAEVGVVWRGGADAAVAAVR
jgi:SAM-dependent methyltransferase